MYRVVGETTVNYGGRTLTLVKAMNTDNRPLGDTSAKKQVAEVGDAVLPPEAQDAIGRRLRSVYGELVAEPLPDKFRELLDRLAKSEKQS